MTQLLDPDQPMLPGLCPRCGGFGLPTEHRACRPDADPKPPAAADDDERSST